LAGAKAANDGKKVMLIDFTSGEILAPVNE
jgi:hypothetical protein